MKPSGNIKYTHDFKPFSVELPPVISTESRIKYTGQERDNFTNYDYMHFRFYASSMGRFLKPDNLIPDITNPQNWNGYTYVKGNPVNFNDPSGHETLGKIGQTSIDYDPGSGETSVISDEKPQWAQIYGLLISQEGFSAATEWVLTNNVDKLDGSTTQQIFTEEHIRGIIEKIKKWMKKKGLKEKRTFLQKIGDLLSPGKKPIILIKQGNEVYGQTSGSAILIYPQHIMTKPGGVSAEERLIITVVHEYLIHFAPPGDPFGFDAPGFKHHAPNHGAARIFANEIFGIPLPQGEGQGGFKEEIVNEAARKRYEEILNLLKE